jgi:hypothetical protein
MRAHIAATAAVVQITGDVGLAAVGLLVAVAVREPWIARTVAYASAAGRADVKIRAQHAATAAVERIFGDEGLAAVDRRVVAVRRKPGTTLSGRGRERRADSLHAGVFRIKAARAVGHDRVGAATVGGTPFLRARVFIVAQRRITGRDAIA